MKKRLLIIGGVAAGASCAVRARRLSEDMEIIIFERGEYVSFANCGLPYYVGKKIKERRKLLVATPSYFNKRFKIEVRLEHEVIAIDRNKKIISVKDQKSNQEYTEYYDALLLAPGAKAMKPPVGGIENEGIFIVKTIPDTDIIMEWIETHTVKHALVIGGGFIGCEMAENLHSRGIKVRIIEMLDQLMPQFDPEMAFFIHSHLRQQGMILSLGTRVMEFIQGENKRIRVKLSTGGEVTTDMVICATGVKPETELAKMAGLQLGPHGGIQVNGYMQTDDPNIWAAGDVVESINIISGQRVLLPLAGPANRQGRLAADSIIRINPAPFRGIQGTSICGIAGLTAASTGLSEKNIKLLNLNQKKEAEADNSIQYEKIYLQPYNHAGYYPGAVPLLLKLIFSKPDGKILGAQSIGTEGVDKRIDIISMAIQKNGTVYDLEQTELCYAPQYGSAKDPVNLAGMIAVNILQGLHPVIHWKDIDKNNVFIIDVRTEREFAIEHIPSAVNIPLHSIRDKIGSLPKNKEIALYCQSGQRSYYAVRILCQNGFNAKNVIGGYDLFQAVNEK